MADAQRLTLSEVAARDGRGGAPVWIVYKDSVYDVTNFISEHPGGDVILEEAGRDSTRAFDEVGHSSDALQMLGKLKCGEIVEEEKKYDASGKKKKRVISAAPEDSVPSGKSCMSVVTCGLLG